jgi:hypothetical protein
MADQRSSPDDAKAPEDLVDESLLDRMLALGPLERLRLNDRMIRSVQLLQAGVDRLRERDHGQR